MQAWIHDAVRTPRGKARPDGGLAAHTPQELVGRLVAALAARGHEPRTVGSLVLGCVGQIGDQGGNIALVSKLHAGIDERASAFTLNNYCVSGLTAIGHAALRVAGRPTAALAGGVEMMSRVPFMADKAAYYGDASFPKRSRYVPVVLAADRLADEQGIARTELDRLALLSQQRAAAAEAVPALGASRIAIDGLAIDECVRPQTTAESLAAMAPGFAALAAQYSDALEGPIDHRHTIAHAPPVCDGAGLALVGGTPADGAGRKARARILAYAESGGDPRASLLAGLAFSIFYSVMGLPLGWVADRWSRRLLIVVGMISWSIMTALCGLATGFLGLFIARIGVGIGEAALSPAAYSLISDYFPPERRARAISAYAMGPYLGSGLALIIGGQVIELAEGMGDVAVPGVGVLAPWQLVFLVVGLPGVLIALLFLLIREPERRGLAPRGSDLSLLAFIGGRRTLFLLLFLGFSVFGIAGISYLVWIPAVFMRVHGWTAGDIGLAYGSILLLTSVPGVFVGGWVSDRLTARGRVDAPITVAAMVMFALVPLVLVTPLHPDPTTTLVLLAVTSFGFGMLNGLPGTALQSVVPNQLRGQIIAAYFLIGTMMSLGSGPTLVAWVSDSLLGGPMQIGVSLATVGAVATLASATMLWVSRTGFREAVEVARQWR